VAKVGCTFGILFGSGKIVINAQSGSKTVKKERKVMFNKFLEKYIL
jgi:hypothetical protein